MVDKRCVLLVPRTTETVTLFPALDLMKIPSSNRPERRHSITICETPRSVRSPAPKVGAIRSLVVEAHAIWLWWPCVLDLVIRKTLRMLRV